MRSIFIVFSLIGLILWGCSKNVYPTTSVGEPLPVDKIGTIIEYETQNNISYKGFIGCDNFYDLYNYLTDIMAKMNSADKALLTKITYRNCVNAALSYVKYLDTMDSSSALDAVHKDYPVEYCFLMGGDWQSLLMGKN